MEWEGGRKRGREEVKTSGASAIVDEIDTQWRRAQPWPAVSLRGKNCEMGRRIPFIETTHKQYCRALRYGRKS